MKRNVSLNIQYEPQHLIITLDRRNIGAPTILAKSPGTLCIFLIWTERSPPLLSLNNVGY